MLRRRYYTKLQSWQKMYPRLKHRTPVIGWPLARTYVDDVVASSFAFLLIFCHTHAHTQTKIKRARAEADRGEPYVDDQDSVYCVCGLMAGTHKMRAYLALVPSGVCGLQVWWCTAKIPAQETGPHMLSVLFTVVSPSVFCLASSNLHNRARLVKPNLLFPSVCCPTAGAHKSRPMPIQMHAATLSVALGGHENGLKTQSYPLLQAEFRPWRTTGSGPIALETSSLIGLGTDKTPTQRR